MITITITVYANGCVKHCRAEGHSEYSKKGKDIVCAAVTVLVRTAAKLLYSDNEILLEGDSPENGALWFAIKDIPGNKVDWVKGITDYLIIGLSELMADHPERVRVEIIQ